MRIQMNDTLKLTEKDLSDLLDAVSLWGKETPDTNDAAADIFANIFSSRDKEKMNTLIREKREEFAQNKKNREREAAILSTKLIFIQRAFMDSPGTFDLNEHLK